MTIGIEISDNIYVNNYKMPEIWKEIPDYPDYKISTQHRTEKSGILEVLSLRLQE
mgnify:CR=1 FL=1